MVDRKIRPQYKEPSSVNLPELKQFQLDNGVNVYAVNSRFKEIDKLVFVFEAGTWKQNKLLVANATNFMLTEGTDKYNSEQIHAFFEYYGAIMQRNTGNHWASRTVFVLDKYFEPVLSRFTEIIFNPAFPEKELSVFREQQKQKLQIELEKVDVLARNEFYKALFGEKHPYGVYALPEDYDKLKSEDLKIFYKNFYRIEGLKIFFVGNLTDEKVKILNDLFGKIKFEQDSIFEEKNFAISQYPDKILRIEKDGAVQTAIRAGHIAINQLHADWDEFNFTVFMLGGYFGSRLMNTLREKMGLTYGVYAMLNSMKYAGVFTIETEVKKEFFELTIEKIREEIKNLQTNPPSEEELTRAKNYYLGSKLRQYDDRLKLTNYLQYIVFYDFDYKKLNDTIDKIKKITPETVLTMANKHLDINRLKFVAVG